MNISYRWLRDLLPSLSLTPEEVAERLTSLGAPVEELSRLGDGLEEIRIARVLSVRPHPNADRLTLCEVDAGDGPVQVVCGAPNVRAEAWFPFAPVGSTLPGGLRLRKARIRGELSNGMLCSEKELGVGRGTDGLMELEGDFSPGDSFAKTLGFDDVRLDVEVTPNRPDLLSHRGVARELGALESPDHAVPEAIRALSRDPVSGDGGWEGMRIRVEAPERAPRYMGAIVRGVKVGPSPRWLQARLRAIGARPINNVVDVTNLILWEFGQPLHAFDLDRLRGGEVVVRGAAPGERLRTLDGVDRALPADALCICDGEGPIAIAGVMGGENSEVGEGSTDILVECALFDPPSVRTVRKALGLSTDASYRYERGIDPEGMGIALARCLALLIEVTGGEVDPRVVEVRTSPEGTPFAGGETVGLRPERVRRVLGIEISVDEIRSLLEPIGFTVGALDPDGALPVRVPGFRGWDVRREIDLIEEVARRRGYDRFPEELGSFRPGTVPDDPLLRLQDRLREQLAGRGFLEGITSAFVVPEEGEVEVRNSLTVEESRLRRSLLPGLLRRVEHNFRRGAKDVRLFEIGTTFHRVEGVALPHEEVRLAVALTGHRAPPHWSGSREPLDLWDVKGLVEDLGPLLSGEPAVEHPLTEDPTFEPGEALAWSFGEVRVRGGRVRPGVIDAPPWANATWMVEAILPDDGGYRNPPTYRPLPQFPGIERDLALLLPDGIEAGGVMRRIREEGGRFLREVEPFDLYRGDKIPEGTRSLACRLFFQADERTLEDGEVSAIVNGILRNLEEEFGVRIR